MNLSVKQEQNHRHGEQTGSCPDTRGGLEWGDGVRRCKLLYIEWINNKTLLQSPGNYIQHPMINHNGRTIKKNVHITQSLCYTEAIHTVL